LGIRLPRGPPTLKNISKISKAFKEENKKYLN